MSGGPPRGRQKPLDHRQGGLVPPGSAAGAGVRRVLLREGVSRSRFRR
jgi:hypothetical protein